MNSPIISVKWLNEHLNNSNIIVLDASPKSNISGLASEYEDLQIPHTRYFDLKKDFSAPNSEFPNTIPSLEQFEKNAQHLGINQDSIIVVYDNLGIYSSPRAWWLFKTFGHENVYVLDGGLPEWIKSGHLTENTSKNSVYNKGNFKAQFLKENIRYYDDIKKISFQKKNSL